MAARVWATLPTLLMLAWENSAVEALPAASEPHSERISGLIEHVTFFNEDSGFCVLRVKAPGHRDLVTVVGSCRPFVTGYCYLPDTGNYAVSGGDGSCRRFCRSIFPRIQIVLESGEVERQNHAGDDPSDTALARHFSMLGDAARAIEMLARAQKERFIARIGRPHDMGAYKIIMRCLERAS
jgi:hypothetical protein